MNIPEQDFFEAHHFECRCSHISHTLRFDYVAGDHEISASVVLDPCAGFWGRVRVALRYVLGLPVSRFGHFGVWLLRPSDVLRLRHLLERVLVSADAERAMKEGPKL